MVMKLAAILVLSVLGLGLVSAGDSFMDKLGDARPAWKSPLMTVETCKTKEGVNEAAFKNMGDRTVTTLSSGEKCFLACLAEKFELVVDGKMATDNVMQLSRLVLAQEPARSAQRLPLTEAAVNACADEVNALSLERCELASRMRDCFFKNDMKIFAAKAR